jgi:hypothetical protein
MNDNSLKSTPTAAAPEVKAPQYSPKKVVRYTSDGKLATVRN